MPRTDELTCRFCGADSRCKIEEVYLRSRTPPMFCVRCYNCGRAGTPKGTKKPQSGLGKKQSNDGKGRHMTLAELNGHL